MNEYQRAKHTFEPVYNKDSETLVLGSFPSVKSREAGFYYYHPQNRFWKMLSAVFSEPLPEGIDEKKKLLLKHHIAVWDVVASCDIAGSSDSSIKNVRPVDIMSLMEKTKIRKVLTNGAAADKLYQRYLYPLTEIEAVKLPSTSPANAAFSLAELCEIWGTELKKDNTYSSKFTVT